MTRTLVVLPRFLSDRTGTGQRSLLLVEAAAAAGPAHVVLLDRAKTPPPKLLGAASVVRVPSDRLLPTGGFARRFGGLLRLAAPAHAYAPDTGLRAALLDLLRDHDIDTVIFRYTSLYMAAGITAADGVRVLVDVDDRDDQKYQTRLDQLLGARLARSRFGRWPLERMASVLRARLSRASHVWFVTPEDIWPLAPATTGLLPNVPYRDAPRDIPAAVDTAPVVLFVGVHDHLPNRDGMRWFLSRVWPGIRQAVPEARLRIVGRGDWAAMAGEFPGAEGVTFVGEVDDLTAEYAAARVAVSPVREGGGSKIKLIEAASFARPVVATSHSMRGFHGDGVTCMVQADDAKGFAAACARFLHDPAAASEAGAALRSWQHATYSRAAFIATVTEALSARKDPDPHDRDDLT